MHIIKLSKEHPTLPLAELRAVLGACYPEEKAVIKIENDRVTLLGIDDVSKLGKRLAYAMGINGEELKQGFDQRYPRKRPFSHPTTLDPKLARCMVNLAQPDSGAQIFDPFCGTGGILLEAGLMGFKTIGIDIDSKMIEGCKKNLDHYGVKNFDITVDDFFKTKKRGVIVTDPPYGKSTSLPGKTVEEFYNLILERLHVIMKLGTLACIGSPTTINFTEMTKNQGFTVKEEHIVYDNQDLSKRIVVLGR
ncbi:MAG: DNA methyltransferase [archaeon]